MSLEGMSLQEISFFATTTSGSKILESWCSLIGLPIDKVNFLFAQLVSLVLAIFYQCALTNVKISSTIRHLYLMIPGLILGFFCFGYQIFNLIFLTIITYLLLILSPKSIVQKLVFFSSIIYLSCLHLLRQINDYGSYTIDITGPSMIAIQKISLLGFSVHDGIYRKKDTLLKSEERVAIHKIPSFLEYFSFILQFPTLMSGPTIHYHDYIEFVEGTNVSKHVTTKNAFKFKRPKPTMIVLEKLSTSFLFAFLLIYLVPKFPIETLLDKQYMQETNFFKIILYLVITTSFARFKYYHAWKLGETILNCCGFGFNGFEKFNRPSWNLISSVDIIPFEFSTNLRDALLYWNKTTQSWLKFVAYDRNKKNKIIYTYLLSAVWHGFYPGYYLTFLSGALFTQAGRSLRKCFRPLFQNNKLSIFFYDLLTFCATKLTIAYLVFPFILLEFSSSLKIYSRFYFIGHIFCLFAIFILPFLTAPLIKKSKNSDKNKKI